MFGDFDLAGISDFIQNDVIARATDMLGTVQTAFKMVNSAVSAGMRLMQGDLSVILMPPSVASDFVHTLQDTWRAGTRLVDNTQDLVQSITTMSGITLIQTGTACGVAHRFRIGCQAKTADKSGGCSHPDDGSQRGCKGGHFTAATRKSGEKSAGGCGCWRLC